MVKIGDGDDPGQVHDNAKSAGPEGRKAIGPHDLDLSSLGSGSQWKGRVPTTPFEEDLRRRLARFRRGATGTEISDGSLDIHIDPSLLVGRNRPRLKGSEEIIPLAGGVDKLFLNELPKEQGDGLLTEQDLYEGMIDVAIKAVRDSDDPRLSSWMTPEKEAKLKGSFGSSKAAYELVSQAIAARKWLIKIIDENRDSTKLILTADSDAGGIVNEWISNNEERLLADPNTLSAIAEVERIVGSPIPYSTFRALINQTGRSIITKTGSPGSSGLRDRERISPSLDTPILEIKPFGYNKG